MNICIGIISNFDIISSSFFIRLNYLILLNKFVDLQMWNKNLIKWSNFFLDKSNCKNRFKKREIKLNCMRNQITSKVKEIIDSSLQSNVSPIFVFIGVESYIDINMFNDYIVDIDTFTKNGDIMLFDKIWFTKIFLALQSQDKNCHILSFAQFTYLNIHINIDFFLPRIIIIRDNLRMLLPISKEEFISYNNGNIVEERRSDNMPEYMSEQIRVGSEYFFSINLPIENFTSINLFEDRIPLKQLFDSKQYEIIDIVNDHYSMDIFINRCIKEQKFDKKVLVKVHKKHPQDNKIKFLLQEANALLKMFGGEMFEMFDVPLSDDFIISDQTNLLLKKYWGLNATFRELRVYKNPDYEKTITTISQGQIVQTIIDEYKHAKEGEKVKDLFLTAPTGAGKSLLFQLPAFFVSENNDVTIVVSPLIALMKDQVNQIWVERGFRKVQYINGELSLIDRDRVIEECKNGEIDILYMAPELLLSYDISFFIGERQLGLLVIDEAHLITTWGRDFRVDYWFLGQHINKIRKYSKYSFPMVAVTATAIYGGDNDMVFDSVNSLNMNNPHMFIGEVKRNDITFVIDNHDKYKLNYDSEKEKETVEFIKKIKKSDIKTIVYTPYTRQIDKIQQRLSADNCSDIAVSYHGGLSVEAKDYAYHRFRTNETKIMISTKAFGMGVDISDIQVVYHHAPSGLLPDYIQEIGRVARKSDIKGFAVLNYAIEDQRYSKILHGMSSIKLFQIKEVLKKVYKVFISGGKKRNMLISVNDFAYIFDNAIEVDQKVMTALMMIEKDYLAKFRFNVLVARPKKLFVKVFARTTIVGYNNLKIKYPNSFEVLTQNNNYYTLKLNLDEIWQKNFSDKSFPRIKHDYYSGKLFENDQIELVPQVRITYKLEKDYCLVCDSLERLFSVLKRCFIALDGHFFTEEMLNDELKSYILEESKRDKIVKFVLATYSGKTIMWSNIVEEDAFLQRRKGVNQKNEYRVINRQYNRNFATLQNRFSHMFSSNTNTIAVRYVSVGRELLTNYIRLGSLLEIMELASYESLGGDNPMLFIRINDPLRIKRDSEDDNYYNTLLKRTLDRYQSSSELFDHFFLHSFDNEERWNFIEDYFLGKSNDELLEIYPGGERNHIDIVQFLENNVVKVFNNDYSQSENNKNLNIFPPCEGEVYDSNRLLTLDNQTMKISNWITNNPIALDKAIRKYKLFLPDYKYLQSKLLQEHFEYFRDVMGLNLWIEYPGYKQLVAAIIPYTDEPVKFYKWWKMNEDKVCLSFKEKITLFLKVETIKSGTLIKRHKTILENKK